MADVEQARKTGGMIALIPSDADARRLLVDAPNAEGLDDLHVTLLYLGEDVTRWDRDTRTWVLKAAERAADAFNGPVQARAFAHATFNPDGGPDGDREPCAVYLIGDVDNVGHVRQSLKGQAQAALEEDFPKQHEPYVPHLTAGYGLTAADLDYVGPVTFDRIEVHLGADHTVLPLRQTRPMGQKDVYGTMAPMAYTRGLGASPSKPRQSPPPTIVGRAHGPSLRGQVRRLKRRKPRDGVKALADARGRISTKMDPELAEIVRVASGWDQPARDLTGIKTAMARIEVKTPQPASGDEFCMACHQDVGDEYEVTDGAKWGFEGMDAVVCLSCADPETKRAISVKGAPSRMPEQLQVYWAEGPGLARWANRAHPWTTLRRLLIRYGVTPERQADGATSNLFRRAMGYWPSERGRNGGGKKSLQDALARL